MTRTNSEQDYRNRIARVVAAIVADPMAPHSLATLAGIAHFSPFHFHRIYHAIAGETVAATIRRLRLARAALLLGAGQISVTRIGLESGYESPQAFTRAFRNFTGNSPRGFQKQMNLFAQRPVPELPAQSRKLSVHLVERPAMRVHALRHHGPNATIPHVHRRLREQVGQRPVAQWLGIMYGDADAGPDSGFRYYAGAALETDLFDVGEVEMIDIPEGTYASHTLAGPYSQINTALFLLYSEWLPRSGLEPENRPALEHYLNNSRNAAPEALRTDLLIPVRPLSVER